MTVSIDSCSNTSRTVHTCSYGSRCFSTLAAQGVLGGNPLAGLEFSLCTACLLGFSWRPISLCTNQCTVVVAAACLSVRPQMHSQAKLNKVWVKVALTIETQTKSIDPICLAFASQVSH